MCGDNESVMRLQRVAIILNRSLVSYVSVDVFVRVVGV